MMMIIYVLATLLALVGPIIAAILLLRRFKVEWQVLIYGMVAYIGGDIILRVVYSLLDQAFASSLAQMQDVLLVYLLASLAFGLATGLGVVLVKFLVFRIFRTTTNSWKRATLVGVGYGGFEVMLAIGLPLLFALITFLTYNGQDMVAMGLTPEQSTQAQEFLTAFSAQPVSNLFTYMIQSVLQIALHILTAILVWFGVSQRKYWWLAAAAGWQALIAGGQVFVNQLATVTESDAPVWLLWLVFTAFTGWMILQSKKKMQVEEE